MHCNTNKGTGILEKLQYIIESHVWKLPLGRMVFQQDISFPDLKFNIRNWNLQLAIGIVFKNGLKTSPWLGEAPRLAALVIEHSDPLFTL